VQLKILRSEKYNTGATRQDEVKKSLS